MKARILTILLRLVVIASLLTVQTGHLPVLAQGQTDDDDFFVYLPLILRNYTPLPEGMTVEHGTTDSNGEAIFNDSYGNAQVTVEVEDENGYPVPGMDVHFISNGNEARALVIDPNIGSESGYYYPAWGEVEYPSASIQSPNVPILIAIPIILVGGGFGFYHGYKLGEDPPRVDLEMGYTRVCFTYEQFKHTAAVGGIVLAVFTAGGSAFWHFAGEVAVEEVALEAGGYITEWAEDQVPVWPDYWCFRKSWFSDGWWYMAERAYYYSDHGNGPTTANVKIYNGQGQLIGDFNQLLYDEDWWYVYTVSSLPGQVLDTPPSLVPLPTGRDTLESAKEP